MPRLAPGSKNAILHPALYSPPLFPITSQREARIGFRPPFLGYKYHPLHTPLPLPPTWPGPGLPLGYSCLCQSAPPGSRWRGAGPPHETEPHSWLRSGVLSHGGGRLWAGGMHTQPKAKGMPAPVTRSPSTFWRQARVRSVPGTGWGEAGAGGQPSGSPAPAETGRRAA